MPAIIIPSKWRAQPQYPVEIDYGNPLCAGLAAALTPINGYHMMSSSGTYQTIAIANGGKVWKGNASGVHWVQFPAITSPVATILRLGSISRNSLQNSWGAGNTTGSSTVGTFTQFYESDSNNQAFVRSTNGGTQTQRQYAAHATATSVAPVCTVARCKDNSTLDVYWDGVQDNGTLTTGSTGSPDWGFFGPNSLARGTTRNPTEAGMDAQLGAVWRRALSDAEVWELSQNPWQIFKPLKRRIYFKNPEVAIYSVTPSSFDDAHAGIVIAGDAFGASQGSSTVTIGGIAQTVTAWSNTSITITAETTGLSMGSATLTVTKA